MTKNMVKRNLASLKIPLARWIQASLKKKMSEMNRLVRFAKAEDNNARLGEITRKVTSETQGKEAKLNNLRYDLQFLGGLLNTYNQIRSSELSSAKEDERWEKEFELKLYDSQTSRMRT